MIAKNTPEGAKNKSQRQETLKSRTIFCRDNLEILRGINSNSIELIYLDPPFNKGKEFHAPIGTTAEGASFHDIWFPDEVKDEWHVQVEGRQPELYKYFDAVSMIGSRSAKYYLIYMAIRLIEMHRILKKSGSIYLHCDPTASHYLKLLMDTIFGHENFVNEIVWGYRTGGASKRRWSKKHDVVLLYAKNEKERFFDVQYQRIYYEKPFFTTKEDSEGRLYADVIFRDVWDDIKAVLNMSKESTSYPTQKPLPLIERIIMASSKKNDVVLDPFCGCATTCIAAERLERNWIGIDISKKAYELVQQRLNNEVPVDLFRGKPFFRNDRPTRTDINYKSTPTKEDKQLLFGRQNSKCAGCGTNFEIQHFEIDHIIPSSQGGSHERENLQLLCSNCNRLKGNRPMEYLTQRLKIYR